MSQNTYHITSAKEWQAARDLGQYEPKGFVKDEFIHLSYRHQLLTVAHRFYREQSGLVILVINSSKIKDCLVEENLEGGIELYPHCYGALPLDAVIKAISFPCNADGSFDLPSELNI